MKAGGGPNRSGNRATTTAKRRHEPKAARVSGPAKAKVEAPATPEVEQLALELQEARERQAEVTRDGLHVRSGGETREVRLRILPVSVPPEDTP